MIILSPDEEKVIEKFSEILREFRISAGLRQKDLAEKIAVSLPVIIDMEKGRGGKVSFATWIAALSVVGALSQLKNLLDMLEPDPFKRFEIRKKKRQRVRKTYSK